MITDVGYRGLLRPLLFRAYSGDAEQIHDRTLAAVAGGYITAMLAPDKPMLHATVLGIIGLALSVAGVVNNAINHLGPDWYPLALAVTAFPSAWIGGRLRGASKKATHS